ncbi:MAG: acyl-CoA thioesterase [Arenicella sp.]
MWQRVIIPRFSDTDALRHINNVAIADWFESGRRDLFKLFIPDLDPRKWNLVLAKVSIEFKQQLYYQHEVTIETAVKKIGNSSFVLQQRALQTDRECAVAEVVAVHFDHDQQKTVIIPDSIRTELTDHLL